MIYRYSTINDAHKCLKLYEYKHIQGLQEPGPLSGDMAFGTALHLAISEHFAGFNAQEAFKEAWDSLDCSTHRFGRFNHEQLHDLGMGFMDRWIRLHAKHYKPFKVEQSLRMSMGTSLIQGTPDFVGEYKGIPSIIDFKTSAKAYDKKQIEIGEQMRLYAFMAKKAWGYEAKQLVYVVFNKQEDRISVLEKEITEASQKDAIDNIELMIKDLSTRSEFPKNRNSCLYCPFYERCYT